jgi:UDP-glucose 4-epimerase
VLALEAAAVGNVVPRVMECGPLEHATVLAIAQRVVDAAGGRSEIKHLPMRPGETPGAYVTCDPETLGPIGFDPDDLKPLAEGVAETVDWYAEHWLPTWRAEKPQQWCLDRGGDCGWCAKSCKALA